MSKNLNKLFGHTLIVETITPTGDGSIATPTKSLVKEDTGTTYFCDVTAGHSVFQLPAPVAGLNFTFVLSGNNPLGGKDLAVFTDATGTDIFGIGLEAGAHDATAQSGVSTLQLDHSAGALGIGDRFQLVCDGTNWYITDLVVTTASAVVGNAGHVLA